MTQPVLVQSLTDEFEDILQGAMLMTPDKPWSILTNGEKDVKLSPEMHTRYQTGVGKLLYLMTHSRPDIANAVRDLATQCHCPTKGHWDSMCYCIRYV